MFDGYSLVTHRVRWAESLVQHEATAEIHEIFNVILTLRKF